MRLLELSRTYGNCEIHIVCFIHVHEIRFIRNIRRSNVWSLHWSVWRLARSLVRMVLLIHQVRYTTKFQAVEVYHFPLPGIVDCWDTIGYIANPSGHNVRSWSFLSALSSQLGYEGILHQQPQFALQQFADRNGPCDVSG